MRDPVEAWLKAETTVGDPAAVARAAASLPPRLAAILRAMEALDAGDEHAVRLLAAELQPHHPDVAAVLAVSVADRRGADPSLWREVPETIELPLRDLLAAFDVARRGGLAVPSARLLEESGYRPLLLSAVRLMSDDRSDVFTNPLVRAASPRADELQMATRAQQLMGHTARRKLESHLGELTLRLEPPRWPAVLDSDEPGDLLRWTRARTPWIDAHDHKISALLGASEDHRRAALGSILRRVARDIPLGRVAGMARPVRAAVSLALSLELEPELLAQLSALQLRTDHLDPEITSPPTVLLTLLWAERSRLLPEEEILVALALLGVPHSQLDPGDLHSALMVGMARTPSSHQAGALLLQLATRMPLQRLVDGLVGADASADRKRHLLALHAAGAGFVRHALPAVPRLLALEPPDVAAVSQILRTVAAASFELDDDTRSALAEALTALAHAATPSAPWGPVVANPSWRALVPEASRAPVLDRIHDSSRDATEVAAGLLLIAHWGDADRLKRAVRDIGRSLRQLPAPDADDLALQTLSWVFAWNGAEARVLVTGPLRPLSRYLARQHGAPLASASTRLPSTGPEVAGALDWYLFEGQDLTPAGSWRNLLRDLLAAPAELAELFRQVVVSHDLTSCRSLSEAAASLQAELQVRVNARHHLQPIRLPSRGEPEQTRFADTLALLPPALQRCLPGVHLDAHGRLVTDPWQTLDLEPGTRDPTAIRQAWATALTAHPPESDPEGARAIREARDRLLDPAQVLDRELGVIHVPDALLWALPDLRGPQVDDLLSPEARLLGLAVLYTLVEEVLWTAGLGDRIKVALSQLASQQGTHA